MSNGTPALRLVGELPRSADLVVIGGGIVGAATAFFASRAGLRRCCWRRGRRWHADDARLDRRLPAPVRQPGGDRAGARRASTLFERLRRGRRPARLRHRLPQRRLSLLHDDRGRQSSASAAGSAAQHGWGLDDVELLTGDEARYRFPYLSPAVRQARYRAGDGWLDPTRLTLGYAIASQAADLPVDAGHRLPAERRPGRRRADAARRRSPASTSSSPPGRSPRAWRRWPGWGSTCGRRAGRSWSCPSCRPSRATRR